MIISWSCPLAQPPVVFLLKVAWCHGKFRIVSSSDEIFAHNIWNPMIELPFHVQIGFIFELFVDEVDLARIACSCHFALDFLCDKGGGS